MTKSKTLGASPPGGGLRPKTFVSRISISIMKMQDCRKQRAAVTLCMGSGGQPHRPQRRAAQGKSAGSRTRLSKAVSSLKKALTRVGRVGHDSFMTPTQGLTNTWTNKTL